ncbi:SAM-dependent DNA methyltransferase [Nocardioides sp. QY071]|uniref:Eco57I restriction-modification methylase domain-containing protein n=1 Tax=Nocardioides sp. QY071 TaxID=3044187 RepID=UPI00249B5D31|nr:type IIL restriction-modification enzyme MmeI [Nocardioides sp. QY071]WGY02172.1 SAM-dependent DNA methyltransferase [Nocardioides sp. QY071]
MRKRTHKRPDVHSDWLAQVDSDGPFLSHPVLKDMWPDGVDRLGDADDRLVTFKQAYARWQRAFDQYVEQPKTPESKNAYDAVRRAWIDVILDDLAEWKDLRGDSDVMVRSPGDQITVTATGALKGRDGDTAALLLVCDPTSGLRDAGLDGWAANDVDRLAMLLRKAQVEVGIVTDGQWWALVWAKDGKPTGSGMVNALTWAEEPLLRDAFFTLINQRRFRASDAEQRLPRLFERSELEAEEITEALGTQVRRSVELLVQAFSEARLEAAKAGDPDPLTEKPDDIYQAAVTVMMRIVFLLFAEERDMLPTEQLYWDSYAIKDLLDDLRTQAAAGEEHLDETYDAWHRLLAVSQALHGGVNYDEMRMPAYGGSLLDPERLPWLHATDRRGLRLKISDRVMLHVLESVQTVVAKGERRRISFREIDVEQIGYIYEGLLGYSCAEVAGDIILGLVGKDGAEPEIPLAAVNDLYDDHGGDAKKFASALAAWIKDNQPAATGKSVAALAKLVDQDPAGDDRAELVRLLSPLAAGDSDLLENLVGWGSLIRRDLRNIPLVFPIGGLVVVETPSRKNAGAHYTPRSLAEEVVLHALQPLVYEPGPLQSNDENEWRLKSASAILDLKVADIAAGSGAFLVAAARYLSERLVEAWVAEGMVDGAVTADPEELRRQALREVIARCLYGADINPMAVEMCKLSLWLVSMDKTKPFSFVDDKVFCGNSLFGLTSLDQLRYLHIAPKPSTMQQQMLVDIDAKIAAATRLRNELASPVDEHDPMRSSRAKARLFAQFLEVTADLRSIADGVVAAALPLGGKPGRTLDDAFKSLSWQLHEAFPPDESTGDRAKLDRRIDSGLTPTVETDYERWTPLHWVVEAPDVIIDNGGFDAVIGNPPFLGGKKISPALGSNVREWLTNVVGFGARGNADLVVFFLLRAFGLLTSKGGLGLIATNTLAQGDSREVGLDQLVSHGFVILRSVQSRRWPAASAMLDYAAVWGTKAQVSQSVHRVADGDRVHSISTLLEPEGTARGNPLKLRENSGIAFAGVNVNGDGFLLSAEEAASMIAKAPRNAEVVRPYVGGEDLNGSPTHQASRWVIDFVQASIGEAEKYPEPLEWLKKRAYSYRQSLTNKPKLQSEWWLHERSALSLRKAIAELDEVLAITVVSKTVMPVRVSTDCVFSLAVCVFAQDSYAFQAIVSSAFHQAWAIKYGSAMKSDPRYVPSDTFETFPRPTATDALTASGRALEEERKEIMVRRGLGLTALYNLVNSPQVIGDPDVDRLRDLHVEIDAVTLGAYGWDDVPLGHGFYAYRQMERWTVSPAARVEIFDRLLKLNHERARAEGQHVQTQGSTDGQDTLFA